MKKSLARFRLPIFLASIVGLIAVSTRHDAAFARADEPTKPAPPTLASGGTIEVQEEIAPHFLRFGPSLRRGKGEVYGIYKFSPFRVTKSDGTTVNWVEFHLGHGGGAMNAATLDDSSGLDTNERAFLNGKLFTSADSYTSVIRFVLTKEQLQSVDQFITEMEGVKMNQPDPMITFRFADGRWGDFRIRKDTSGSMSVLIGKNEAGWECWEAIDGPSFHAAIKLALKRVESLSSKPVSATITVG